MNKGSLPIIHLEGLVTIFWVSAKLLCISWKTGNRLIDMFSDHELVNKMQYYLKKTNHHCMHKTGFMP